MNQVEKLKPIDYLKTCIEYELHLFLATGIRVIELEDPRGAARTERARAI